MISSTGRFLADIYRQRHVIRLLARREFLSRYAGTTAGMFWVIAQPAATVLIFWFVFGVGLRASGPAGADFLPWFVCGLVPWLMFSEVLTMSTNGVRGNLQLIKKTRFPSEVLPIVYIGAAAAGHGVLVVLALLVGWARGVTPGIGLLALPLYFAALCFLLLGLCWLVSAFNVFHRDIGQSLGIVLNLWFWLTPVVWNRSLLPDRWGYVVSLNPMAFIVDGYRSALLGTDPGAVPAADAVPFLLVSLPVFILGAEVFRRLKLEFADSV
jgi:lipopolysaccharide transport system permease protein/teichoic acid transport system permease protein